MSGHSDTIREALNDAVALDNEWWNANHSGALAALAALEQEREQVEHREGMVEVYDWHGDYLGCMGIEMWHDRLAAEARAVAAERERDEAYRHDEVMTSDATYATNRAIAAERVAATLADALAETTKLLERALAELPMKVRTVRRHDRLQQIYRDFASLQDRKG